MSMVRWWFFGLLCGLICAAILSGVVAYITAPQWYRVLIVGSDQRGSERARSDVMMVLSIPRDSEKLPVTLSIPRDTRVDDEEYGLQKMTHFYALGERPEGKLLGNIDLTQKQIEELLGVSIDATVEVSFQSFVEIIQELGGACIEDQCDASGEQSLAIIRDRFSDGRSDFSRQEDSRQLVVDLMRSLRTRESIQRLAEIFRTSDMARLQYTLPRAIHFVFGYSIAHRGRIELQDVESLSIPGSSDMVFTESFGKKLYYWIPDRQKLSEIMNSIQ